MKTHCITEYHPHFVLAYVANGVVGLRPHPIPLSGTCTVNGFAGNDPTEGVESWVYAPYPVALDINLNGTWLSQQPDAAHFERQEYDFSCGELRTFWTFRVGDITARIETLTLCARSLPSLVLQETRVTLNRPAHLTLRAGIDGASAQANCVHRGEGKFGNRIITDGVLLWESPGGLSRLGIAYLTEFEGQSAAHKSYSANTFTSGWATDFTLEAQANTAYTLRQISSLVPSVMHHEPERQAVRLAFVGATRGFARLRDENRQAWSELWQGGIKLLGASQRWQDIADACFFYVHSSIHAASPCSTSLFGVGQWPGYHCFRGHVFWDIETFTLPPLLLTAPDSARAILEYRFRHLDAARRNAALNGYRGLQFPWESGPLSGEEVTPSGWPHIIFEQHISLDVAFAFAQFSHATGDAEFLRDRAWPVLKGVAEWICSRVERTQRGYEIRQTMGICEGEITDNNSFVNLAARVVLQEAIRAASRLGMHSPPLWHEVASDIFMPMQGDLILRCDGYQPDAPDNCTETLAAFYPYTFQADSRVTETTIRHYLQKGREAFGWPMLPPLFGVHAARLRDRDLSAEMFERGVGDYIIEPFLQMDEFGKTKTQTKAKVGPYLAHAGAFLMDCLYGLTCLQPGPEPPQEWCRFPVTMPSLWAGVEVERIWVRGEAVRLIAHHGSARSEIEQERKT